MLDKLVEKEAEVAVGPVETVAALQSIVAVLLDRVPDQMRHIFQSTTTVATLEVVRFWMVDVDVL